MIIEDIYRNTSDAQRVVIYDSTRESFLLYSGTVGNIPQCLYDFTITSLEATNVVKQEEKRVKHYPCLKLFAFAVRRK